MENPLTISICNGDRWQQIQSIRGGASEVICRKNPDTGERDDYDSRGYGDALMELCSINPETGQREPPKFSLLYQMVSGPWEPSHMEQYIEFLKLAASFRSAPMVLVALIVAQCLTSKQKLTAWTQLESSEQRKIIFLAQLAISDPSYTKYFEHDVPEKAVKQQVKPTKQKKRTANAS